MSFSHYFKLAKDSYKALKKENKTLKKENNSLKAQLEESGAKCLETESLRVQLKAATEQLETVRAQLKPFIEASKIFESKTIVSKPEKPNQDEPEPEPKPEPEPEPEPKDNQVIHPESDDESDNSQSESESNSDFEEDDFDVGSDSESIKEIDNPNIEEEIKHLKQVQGKVIKADWISNGDDSDDEVIRIRKKLKSNSSNAVNANPASVSSPHAVPPSISASESSPDQTSPKRKRKMMCTFYPEQMALSDKQNGQPVLSKEEYLEVWNKLGQTEVKFWKDKLTAFNKGV